MLVSGGWRRRGTVKFIRALALVVVAGASALIGCGSRTSVLDLEGYEVGGSGVGGSSSTGGTAGTKPVTSAGSSNSPTVTQCAQYCSGYATTCASELKGRDCQRVCQAEIDGSGEGCRVLGVLALKCLTPIFQVGNGTCDAATKRGLAQCATELAGFKNCQTGKPTPNPGPIPTPNFMDPTSCKSMGQVSPGRCEIAFACAQGAFRTDCDVGADGASAHCTCFHDDTGWMGAIPTNDFSLACFLAASHCPGGIGVTSE